MMRWTFCVATAPLKIALRNNFNGIGYKPFELDALNDLFIVPNSLVYIQFSNFE